jgi:hypothetical protein
MAAAEAGISEAAEAGISEAAAGRISVGAAGTSAVEGRISEAAALASAEAGCTLAAHISAARALVAGPRHRTLRHGQVSTHNARIQSAAAPTARPAAQRG